MPRSEALTLHSRETRPFDAEVDRHLKRFTGRQWVFEAMDIWLRTPNRPAFWIKGQPGTAQKAVQAVGEWLQSRQLEDESLKVVNGSPSVREETRRRVLDAIARLGYEPNPTARALSTGQSQALFLPVLFETISAFGTVGLSLNYTPLLSDTGRIIVALIMLMGRAGPLTIALAVSARERRQTYRYAEENIMVG